jgi:hypothetical protein
MKWFRQKPAPQNLEEWLAIATKNIIESEAEAIKREIQNHYQEELEQQLATNLPVAQAEALALAELGNAYKANTGFRKTHVTEGEWEEWHPKDKESEWLYLIALFGALYLDLFVNHIFKTSFFVFVYPRLLPGFLYRYYSKRNNVILGLKYSQRFNLLYFPCLCISPLVNFSFYENSDWRSWFLIFLALYGFWSLFSDIPQVGKSIRKAERFFKETSSP